MRRSLREEDENVRAIDQREFEVAEEANDEVE